jgi:glycosyltransferase involved in cell wall biosynthesis
MRQYPRVLRIESDTLFLLDTEHGTITQLSNISAQTPRLWRKIEHFLRMDIMLSLYARSFADQCDIVWAGSEKVGIPLSFIGLRKPLVVIAHHMSSPMKARIAKMFRVVNHWAGIGYISDEAKSFFTDYFNVTPERLFQYESSKYLDRAAVCEVSYDGPLMSVGVAKRDYNTLITALSTLPGYKAELFVSSKFGDQLKDRLNNIAHNWIDLIGWIAEDDLMQRYQHTRFAVVPLHDTTHSGAGINAVLEAAAFGKAVIGTKTGGMATFIKDGETGILVPPYDADAWKSAIHTLWTQPDLARKMGQAGRRYIESRFHPDEVNAKISAFLKDLHTRQLSRQ